MASSGEGRSFRRISRDRLLHEMLRHVKKMSSKSTWKVLILDKVTVRIMSCSFKFSDVTAEGFSLVEGIHKRRQALPSTEAIYFIQPIKENIVALLEDMSGESPLYTMAHIFFSSGIQDILLNYVKMDKHIMSRLGSCRVINLEYFPIDCQGFVTDDERALEKLFGVEESSRISDACLSLMATRIATVFASLGEFPSIRYHAAKSFDPATVTTFRELIPTKLAAGVLDCLLKLPGFPQKETCELLVLDRSIDQIAPLMHEWTYDAMCHDLLNIEGNKYMHEVSVPSKTGGLPEKKEVLLDDRDPVWLELRDAHIAEASERLHEKMTRFMSQNKAAQIYQHSRDGGELSTRDLQKMVQALPQYNEQTEKLSIHADIAAKLNRLVGELGLKELGQLEQDLVFGDAGTDEVLNYLGTKPDVTSENKLRLLMIYAAIYPEKIKDHHVIKLMELARLPTDDMNAVHNMRLLEGSFDARRTYAGIFSVFNKRKRAVRKDRVDDGSPWQLSRFYPLVEELIEKLAKGELSKDDYPYVHDLSQTCLVKSKRTATWARPQSANDCHASDPIRGHASSDFQKRRIFVFIVGGATRSELRVCHKLTMKLKREIVLGSSSLDDPLQFITKMKLLSAHELASEWTL